MVCKLFKETRSLYQGRTLEFEEKKKFQPVVNVCGKHFSVIHGNSMETQEST